MVTISPEINESANLSQAYERNAWSRKLGFATVLALFVTGTITFLVLFGLTNIEPNQNVVRTALVVNTLLALVLITLIGIEVSQLLYSRRKGRAAARLHIRIVGLFALVAAIPAIIVAIVASITLDLGLDRWFEKRTTEIVQSSVSVAEAYVNESARVHVNSTISMAADLDAGRQVYSLDRSNFIRGMDFQTKGRGMLLAALVREDGEVIIESKIDKSLDLPKVPLDSLKQAIDGSVIFIPRGRTNIVGAIKKMEAIPDAYLYTIRLLREDVLSSIRLMEENTSEYSELANNRLPVQLTFAVLYLAVALIILLSAIYMGISVADRFVRPIRRLITAADEVSSGNLDIQVETKHTEGDFKNLSDTFNTMISDLGDQRKELISARDVLDQRARFTQAVLSGVSAAVLSVDSKGKIQIANKAAQNLFAKNVNVNSNLQKTIPEIYSIIENATENKKSEHHEQISYRIGGKSLTLNVQVTQEEDEKKSQSVVVTVDDITNLVAAQRSSAWADVARRIAHEIKNPLTPIQLSAERIKKRYGKYIEDDRDVFDQCTDTIIRQVGDIGKMVDEFSSFARMPKPEMALGDISATVQEALFTQKVSNPKIEFSFTKKGDEFTASFDSRLLSQALINIIKNAVEAIDAVMQEKPSHKGKVQVLLKTDSQMILIDVIDNGKGLPEENREKLLEPYMTTRQKGTGLGLAIVRKIMEDHDGSIELMDAPNPKKGQKGKGALMRLWLPAVEPTANEKKQQKKKAKK